MFNKDNYYSKYIGERTDNITEYKMNDLNSVYTTYNVKIGRNKFNNKDINSNKIKR